MQQCKECKIKYPSGFVDILITNEGNLFVCGICALKISNKSLGINRTEFQGETAEVLRQMAIKFRKGLAKVTKK